MKKPEKNSAKIAKIQKKFFFVFFGLLAVSLAISAYMIQKASVLTLKRTVSGIYPGASCSLFAYGTKMQCVVPLNAKEKATIVFSGNGWLFPSTTSFVARFDTPEITFPTPEGTAHFQIEGSAVRNKDDIDISFHAYDLQKDLHVMQKNRLKFVSYPTPKTVNMLKDAEEGDGKVAKTSLKLPYEMLILENSYVSYVLKSKDRIIEEMYENYKEEVKKEGARMGNLDFLNEDSDKEVSPNSFASKIEKLSSTAFKNTESSVLEPIYAAYYAKLSDKGIGMYKTQKIKPGKEPLGVKVSMELASFSFDNYVKEIASRYQIKKGFVKNKRDALKIINIEKSQ